jgi:hypothetical protein
MSTPRPAPRRTAAALGEQASAKRAGAGAEGGSHGQFWLAAHAASESKFAAFEHAITKTNPDAASRMSSTFRARDAI